MKITKQSLISNNQLPIKWLVVFLLVLMGVFYVNNSIKSVRAEVNNPTATPIPGTPTLTPTPTVYRPAYCQSASISKATILPGEDLTITSTANVSTITGFQYSFYNLNNLYPAPPADNPKQICFNYQGSWVGDCPPGSFQYIKIIDTSTSPTNQMTVSVSYDELARGDLNHNGEQPLRVQVNAYFAGPDGFSAADPACVVKYSMSTCATKTSGDANCDGVVNSADFDIWKCEFLGGGTCPGPPISTKSASFDLNDKVDLIDYEIWRKTDYESVVPSISPTSVPTVTITPTPLPEKITTINSFSQSSQVSIPDDSQGSQGKQMALSADGKTIYTRSYIGDWNGNSWFSDLISNIILGVPAVFCFSQSSDEETTTAKQYAVSLDGQTLYSREYKNGVWHSNQWTSQNVSNLGINGVGAIACLNQNEAAAQPASLPNQKQTVVSADGQTIYYRFYNGGWGSWTPLSVAALSLPDGATTIRSITQSVNPEGLKKQDVVSSDGKKIYTRTYNDTANPPKWGDWTTLVVNDLLISGTDASYLVSMPVPVPTAIPTPGGLP